MFLVTYIVETEEDYALDEEIGVVGVYENEKQAEEAGEKIYEDFKIFKNIYNEYLDNLEETESKEGFRYSGFDHHKFVNEFANNLPENEKINFLKYVDLFSGRDYISYRITELIGKPKSIKSFVYYE